MSQTNPENEPTAARRIKVAMIGDYPRDLNAIDGGVQAVTAYLVTELSRMPEIDLHVVTFDSRMGAPERLLRDDFTQYLLPTQRLGAMTRWHLDFRSLRRCLQGIEPDVVHAQGAGVDGFLAVRNRWPCVVTFHGMIGEDAKYTSGFVARTRLRLQSMTAEKYCARNADRTILISPYVKEYYGALLRNPSRFIPNPVRQSFYDVRRLDVPGRILFAGRVIPRKGVTDLLNAFAAVRRQADARLVLAGSLSDAGYVSRARELARALEVEEHVEFRGLLKEDELLDEFSRASMLVLPSYQETAPMVVQQSMAASVPVVATRICGLPYQVEHGRTGFLFEPGDVEALADHMTRLIEDEGLRRNMAGAARARAEADYRADRVAAQTVEVYEELLETGTGRHPEG